MKKIFAAVAAAPAALSGITGYLAKGSLQQAFIRAGEGTLLTAVCTFAGAYIGSSKTADGSGNDSGNFGLFIGGAVGYAAGLIAGVVLGLK